MTLVAIGCTMKLKSPAACRSIHSLSCRCHNSLAPETIQVATSSRNCFHPLATRTSTVQFLTANAVPLPGVGADRTSLLGHQAGIPEFLLSRFSEELPSVSEKSAVVELKPHRALQGSEAMRRIAPQSPLAVAPHGDGVQIGGRQRTEADSSGPVRWSCVVRFFVLRVISAVCNSHVT
jgi:hypothetical protein